MGSAFTTEEQQLIRQDLKKAARKYLAIMGMKKTSVEQLSSEVGISKGAFYKFYQTKEHLFYEIMEDVHNELYVGARKFLVDPSLPNTQARLEGALFYAYETMCSTSIFKFMLEELPYVLRKLSPTIMEEHQEEDADHIGQILQEAGIHLKYPPDFVSNLLRSIITLSQTKMIIGENQTDEVVRFLIHTISAELLKDATFGPEQDI